MSDWFQPVPLFEGEDEGALKADFARLWAKHPNQLPPDIGRQVFSLLKEPMRGLQAGAVWSRELSVMELRDKYIREGLDDQGLADEDQTAKEVLAAARQAYEPKDKAILFKLYAEIRGYIVKPDKTIKVDLPNRPQRIELVAVEPKLFTEEEL